MFAAATRLILIALAVFGLYKLYPRFRPVVEPVIKPEVLGTEIIHPAVKTINSLLPDNFRIPIPSDTASNPDGGGQVNGVETTAAVSNVVNTVVEAAKQKAGEIAQEQIDKAKEEAGKAFCQVLIEKVKTECGF